MGASLLGREGGHRTHLLRGPRRSGEDSCCQGTDLCHEDGEEGEGVGAEEVGARSSGQSFDSGNGEGLWSKDEVFGPGLSL